MEDIIDAVVAQLMLMRDLDYSDGGFRDEVPLPDNIWWGNPGVLADQQYPYIYVEPVTSVPESETTGNKTRTHTVRIALLLDPREFYDTTEVSEATASREMVRAMASIERWFEKTSLRSPNGLAQGTSKLVVSSTEYAEQFRGNLTSLGAATVLSVDLKLPKS